MTSSPTFTSRPPTLFEHAMMLSSGVDFAKRRAAVVDAVRTDEVLCDRGDFRVPLRSVERSALLSESAFWDFMARKEHANKMYLTTIPQVMKWTAAVW